MHRITTWFNVHICNLYIYWVGRLSHPSCVKSTWSGVPYGKSMTNWYFWQCWYLTFSCLTWCAQCFLHSNYRGPWFESIGLAEVDRNSVYDGTRNQMGLRLVIAKTACAATSGRLLLLLLLLSLLLLSLLLLSLLLLSLLLLSLLLLSLLLLSVLLLSLLLLLVVVEVVAAEVVAEVVHVQVWWRKWWHLLSVRKVSRKPSMLKWYRVLRCAHCILHLTCAVLVAKVMTSTQCALFRANPICWAGAVFGGVPMVFCSSWVDFTQVGRLHAECVCPCGGLTSRGLGWLNLGAKYIFTH